MNVYQFLRKMREPATRVEVFVPVLARPKGIGGRRVFRAEVRASTLPERPACERLEGLFECSIEFYFASHQTGDIDNLCKPILDLVKGSLIHDDRQIKRLHARINEFSGKTGFNISLRPL